MASEVSKPSISQPGRSPSILKKDDKETVKLVQQLGIPSFTCLIIGTVIGSGIFISPKGILQYTGTVGLSMVVWFLSGVLSTLGALSYCELGTMFSQAGGDFIYLLESYGSMMAFLRVYTCIMAVRTGTYAVLAITAATYLLTPFYPNCTLPDLSVRLLAVVILCVLFVVTSASVPLSSRLNMFFTIVKIGGLILISIAGIVLLIEGKTENFEDAFEGTEFKWIELPLAFYAGLFACSGWQTTASLTEELINPARTLPVSTFIAMAIITGVCVMANVAYFTVLTPAEILASDAVALTFGAKVFGSWSWILLVVVSFSCIGAIIGGVFSTARMSFGAAREGQLPILFSMIHIEYKTPMPATLIMLPITVVLLVGDSVYSLINYLSFTRWLFISLTVTAIPYFRWKHPEWERPFKVNLLIPIIFVACTLVMVSVSLYSSPKDCGIGLLITLSGIPLYYFGVRWTNRPSWFEDAMDNFNFFWQKYLLVVPGEEKDD